MKPLQVAISVCLVALLALPGCGSNNATPEAAAKSLVKAMIAADSKAIDALNKSESSGWPTSRLLKDANEWKMVGSDISDYQILDKGDLVFLVSNKKIGMQGVCLKFMFADGKYYFVKHDDGLALPRANVNAARGKVDLFAVALDTYQLAVGSYPSTPSGLQALRTPPADLRIRPSGTARTSARTFLWTPGASLIGIVAQASTTRTDLTFGP